jgi:quercetin dioxygenase-like cupin family protein
MIGEIDSFSLSSTYVVIGDNGDAIPVAVSDRFFEQLESKFGDFKEERLISHFTFDKDWETWEMHPAGEEFVCLLSGRVDLLVEQDRVENAVQLSTLGSYVLVPRGMWHTARAQTPSSMLFITPSEGTHT